jgi:hypothetical protein
MLNRLPFLFSILAFVGGTFIAILFGANESLFKDRIADGLNRNEKIQKISDPEEKLSKIKSEQEKNWRYYQRYHFHSIPLPLELFRFHFYFSSLLLMLPENKFCFPPT